MDPKTVLAPANLEDFPAATNPRLVAFTGLKSSGKTTAAGVFVEHNWSPIMMAGPLKHMLLTFLDYQGVPKPEAMKLIDDPSFKEKPSPYFLNQTPRKMMQSLGTEWGRDLIHPEIWTTLVGRRIAHLLQDDKTLGVVLHDIRFPNEVAMIRRFGGLVVRINREGLVPSDHPSERHIPTLTVDFDLHNNHSLERFKTDVKSVFQAYL